MAKTNYAGMSKQEVHAAIAKADAKTLDALDVDLARLGYSAVGITRMLVANRKAELTGETPPHTIPTGAGLEPIRGRSRSNRGGE